uniref:Uncharacterized protein n=1 Tax=Plectus sambesii TaxID=2011161 RepID=A0A914V5L7_9BILA
MGKTTVGCGVGCSIFFAIIALLGIALAVLFPLVIFPAALRSQIPLQQDSDGQLSTTTFYWSKPPVLNKFSFNFF